MDEKTIIWNGQPIRNWQHFAKQVRSRGCCLLNNLNDFESPILVSGCQRSGTTALSRALTGSDDFVDYWFGPDDELDAALILSGVAEVPVQGRFCFQTTYLNECFGEYFEHIGKYKLIWVVRNPFSVIYSMLRNWRRFALVELFKSCGLKETDEKSRNRFTRFGPWSIREIHMAAAAYLGKSRQIFSIKQRLPESDLAIVDYDDLVINKTELLPRLYEFIEVPYREYYTKAIHGRSVSKADRMKKRERELIQVRCLPTYEAIRDLRTIR